MAQVVSNDASKSQVEIKLGRDLADLGSLPYNTSRMYKVPPILRNANREAYTPKVISIGPYHCRRRNLHHSYALKIKYLQSFLKRTESQLGIYVKMAQGWEEKVRGYYDEECGLNSDELVQMILIDGIFILEFTWQCYNEPNQGSDGLFMRELLRDDIMRDLTLVENQLPFFVLQGLADLSFKTHGWFSSLTELFIHHFGLFPTFDQTAYGPYRRVVDSLGRSNILHLVGFIHEIILINSSATIRTYRGEQHHIPEPRHDRVSLGFGVELSRSAIELHEAGVKLGCAEDIIFTNIGFTENGLLLVPRLLVNRNT